MDMKILWVFQKKYSPQFIFPVIYQESQIFWQLKLDSGIEVIIGDGISCHSGCFYAGSKCCFFTEAQCSNTFSRGQWVNSVLYSTGYLWEIVVTHNMLCDFRRKLSTFTFQEVIGVTSQMKQKLNIDSEFIDQ